MRFDHWGSITYGQNLEPQGVNRSFAAISPWNHLFYQRGLILSERQGWMSHGIRIFVRRVVENDKGIWVAVVGAIVALAFRKVRRGVAPAAVLASAV